VDVICGTNTGTFDCLRLCVITSSGSQVSPTEFERLSGKGASKKWKCTIRVRKANGMHGTTMGDWLLQMGYDQPKEPRASSSKGNSLNDIRKQQASRKAAAAAAAKASAGPPRGAAAAAAAGGPGVKPSEDGSHTIVSGRGVSMHREGCMCVICKQARRKAAQEAGVNPSPQDAYIPRPGEAGFKGYGSAGARAAGVGGKGGPARSGPVGKDGVAGKMAALEERRARLPAMLLGKRAYVQAVPHLVRGAAVHKLWQLPESRCYSAEEWEAKQQGGNGNGSASTGAAAAAAGGAVASDAQQPAASGGEPPAAAAAALALVAAGGSRAGTPSLSSRPTTPVPAAATEPGDEVTSSAAADMQLALSTQTNQQQQQQGGEKPQRGSRTQTWREKLRLCRSLEPKRITFGKSGIHGWGIFARWPIAQDSMVTEFRGQLVRQIMADVREVAYRKQVRTWLVVWRLVWVTCRCSGSVLCYLCIQEM
jgi:hypothetical protein